MEPKIRIDYKKLRQVNPETARMAVLEYLSSNGKNVSQCAKIFGINRAVVYDIIKKSEVGDLKDRSKAPKNIPHKTAKEIESLIMEIERSTRLPPKRLAFYLFKYYRVDIAYSTLRHILRRNR